MASRREPHVPHHYPFSAVVGADDMALALTLTTISPAVGGVLVRGEKGTAKSTMVRGLASVLPPIEVISGDRFSTDPQESHPLSPDGPFPADAPTESRSVRLVELPVGATEDRVLGSLHLEKALSEGITTYEPGLLARAHRGILYVDEVNLLHDHLVDLLLDAAAMGRSTVERDGVSIEHAAQFVLVGTMNPEEGELRPQLLDRFGLTVEVSAPRDPLLRVEVVKRRLAYEADPDGFAARFADDEAELTDRIQVAQKLVGEVELGAWALTKIAEICAAFEVDGMRADIVTARAASAHAAWNGRTDVLKEDVRAAARLALPHRRRRNPFDAPGIDEDLLDAILDDDEPEPPPPPPPADDDGPPLEDGPEPAEGDGSPPESPPSEQKSPASGSGVQDVTVDAPGKPYRPRLFTVAGTGAGEDGHRSRAVTQDGRRIGAERPGVRTGSIHLTETIRAAAPHQGTRERSVGFLGHAASRSGATTCGSPCARATSRTSCCSASTRPARWRPGDAWSRSRRRSSRCSSTPTSAATRSGSSRSAPARPRSRCHRPRRSTSPRPGSTSFRPVGARLWPKGSSRPPRPCGSSTSATRGAVRCSSSSRTVAPPTAPIRSPVPTRWPPTWPTPACPPWSSTARPDGSVWGSPTSSPST